MTVAGIPKTGFGSTHNYLVQLFFRNILSADGVGFPHLVCPARTFVSDRAGLTVGPTL